MNEAPELNILRSLQPFTWSNDDAISYEVTIELMARVIGLYATLADRPGTSAADRAHYNSERTRLGVLRRDLRSTDSAGVRTVHDECTDLIERLGAQL